MTKNIINLTAIEFFKFIKSPMKIFFVIAFPLLWLILSGYMWGNTAIAHTPFHYMDFMFPGFVIWLTLSSAFQTLSSALSHDRENKILKQYSILNIKKYEYLISLFIFYFINFIIVFFIAVLITIGLFKINIDNLKSRIYLLFLTSIIIFILFFCLGMIIGSIFSSYQSTSYVSKFLFFFLFFTSGAAIPAVSIGGHWFVYLQHISPAGNAVILLQRIFLGSTYSLISNGDFMAGWIYVALFTVASIPTSIFVLKFN